MTTDSRSRALLTLLLALTFAAGGARAGDKQLSVQGKLTDASGTPLTGSQTVTFRLYTSSTASIGSAIWTESQSLSLSSGLFNASLGTSTSMDSLPFNQAYYLGIQVAGDANELSPRQLLGASAYAQGSIGTFTAGGAVLTAGQGVIGGTMTVQGSALSVGGAQFSVNAGSVTTSGTLAVQGRSFTVGGADFAVNNGSVTAGMVTSAGSAFIGGQGVVQGTMTVIGNAFSVGGATFTVAGASVTLGGRLNLAAAGIKWADGSTSTTAANGGGGQTFIATYTFVPAGSTTQQTFSVAFATVTATYSGNFDVTCWLTAAMGTLNNYSYSSILFNGGYISPLGSTTGMMGTIDIGDIQRSNNTAMFRIPKSNVGGGNTSIAVTFRANAGSGATITWPSTGSINPFLYCTEAP